MKTVVRLAYTYIGILAMLSSALIVVALGKLTFRHPLALLPLSVVVAFVIVGIWGDVADE